MGLFSRNNNSNNGYTDLSNMQYGGYQQNPQNNNPYNNPYNNGNPYGQSAYAQQTMQGFGGNTMSLSEYSSKVYLQMFIGLAITFGIGLAAVLNPDSTLELLAGHIEVFLILCLIEVVLVFVLGLFIKSLSSIAATVLFYAYSVINGITIAPALLVAGFETAFWALAVTGGIFGLMSLIGAVTKIDVSKWGSILMFGLIGLIIFSVIAMIFRIPMSDLIICIIGILLFMGFTIYDTKKIKAFYASSPDAEAQKKTVILSALQLYLDFINLFLYILRLFARHSD